MAVRGISGIFVPALDPQSLAEWYTRHFGIEFFHWPERNSYGAEFVHREEPGVPATRRSTVFVFEPAEEAEKPVRFGGRLQYRVRDLERFCRKLADQGVPVERTTAHTYGHFAWASDPEGNRIEIYQPL
jgi:catechol 2,3-dioxygenase-like lactoylglutathione lyase family enzyme